MPQYHLVLTCCVMTDDGKSSAAIPVAIISAVAAIAVALIGIYSPKKSDSPPQTIPATVSQQAQPPPSKTLPQQQPPASTAEISPPPKVSAHLPATSTAPVMKHEVLSSAPKPIKPPTQPSPQIDSSFWDKDWIRTHFQDRFRYKNMDDPRAGTYSLSLTRIDSSHGTGHLLINLWAPGTNKIVIGCVTEYSLQLDSTSKKGIVAFRAERTRREGTGLHCTDSYQPAAVVGTMTLGGWGLSVDAGSTDLSQTFTSSAAFEGLIKDKN